VLVRQYGSPLEFLLRLMGDKTAKMVDRIDAAKAALGYVHRRLPEYDADKCPPLEELEQQRKAQAEWAEMWSGLSRS
jgi:hypothetical protein